MAWFWGSSKKKTDPIENGDEEEYSDEEYDSGGFSDGEDYSDDDKVDMAEVKEHGSEREEDSNSLIDEPPQRLKDRPHSPEDSSTTETGNPSQEESNPDGKANDEIEIDLKSGDKETYRARDLIRHESRHSMSTDGDASLIESEGLLTDDEDFLGTSEEGESDSEEEEVESEDDFSDLDDVDVDVDDDDDDDDEGGSEEIGTRRSTATSQQGQLEVPVVRVETVDEDDSDDEVVVKHEKSVVDEGSDDEEEEVTSFWEKQSLLILAAEHDRVDILKGILTDGDQDRSALMDSGIPPLHVSISFGSTNATQSLLRMGADPSIRPDVAEVKEQQKEAPEGSKVQIQNMGRFNGVTAWELAFGNQAYEDQKRNKKSWSVFGNGSSLDLSASGLGKVVSPVDMQPSKREGIRHAFTAEALRCIGADEVERLQQLLSSGMPVSIEIGEKDLYDWSVQLGGMRCEEYLRPAEAIKYGSNGENSESSSDIIRVEADALQCATLSSSESTGRVLDRSRPGGEVSVSNLINRLDELESLASALSACLDNLAEEVSVCHGLLLMGGGASALASHVKSLKALQQQKRIQLASAETQWGESEAELMHLVQTTGDIGQEVLTESPINVSTPADYSRTESFRQALGNAREDKQKQQLLAQIAACDNKILKLRASIADLSEENAREMDEVERRGLSGGINLVRGLREELRDIEFQLSEAKNMNATCRAKIGSIHSRLQAKSNIAAISPSQSLVDQASLATYDVNDDGIVVIEHDYSQSTESTPKDNGDALLEKKFSSAVPPEFVTRATVTSQLPLHADPLETSNTQQEHPAPVFPGTDEVKRKIEQLQHTTHSERIAAGESQALVLRPSDNRGYFTVDLWQVLLRIIGFDHASNRRGAQVAQQQTGSAANIMIV